MSLYVSSTAPQNAPPLLNDSGNPPVESAAVQVALQAISVSNNPRHLRAMTNQIRVGAFQTEDLFDKHLKDLYEILKEKFKIEFSLDENQVACLKRLSVLPFFLERPLSEAIIISLYFDLLRLKKRIDQCPINQEPKNVLLKTIDEKLVQGAKFADLETLVEIDQTNRENGESSNEAFKALSGSKDDLEKLAKALKLVPILALRGPLEESIREEIEFLLKEANTKISLLQSLIKLNSPKVGEIFVIKLDIFIKEIENRKFDEQGSFALASFVAQQQLITSVTSIQQLPTEDYLINLSNTIEWHLNFFENYGYTEITLPTGKIIEIKKREEFEKIDNLIEDLKKIKAEIQKGNLKGAAEFISDRIEKHEAQVDELSRLETSIEKRNYRPPDLEIRLHNSSKFRFYLGRMISLLSSLKSELSFNTAEASRIALFVRFEMSRSSLARCLDSLQNPKDPSLEDLYADLYQFADVVFLKNSTNLRNKNSENFVKPKISFSQDVFIKQLEELHKKYSQVMTHLHNEGKKEEAEKLEKSYFDRCLELCTVFMIAKLSNKGKRENYNFDLDNFIEGLINKGLWKCVELDILPLDEAKKNEDIEEVRLIPVTQERPTHAPPQEEQSKGTKIKTRNPADPTRQSSEAPPLDEPTAPAPQSSQGIRLSKNELTKKRKLIKALKELFGSVSISEGGSHTKLSVGKGASRPISRGSGDINPHTARKGVLDPLLEEKM